MTNLNCDAPEQRNAGSILYSYIPCRKPAKWEIKVFSPKPKGLLPDVSHYEGACSRAHLALLVHSLAIHGLCEFNVRALTPAAFGPEGAEPPA